MKHPDNYSELIPFVNSPRVGLCDTPVRGAAQLKTPGGVGDTPTY